MAPMQPGSASGTYEVSCMSSGGSSPGAEPPSIEGTPSKKRAVSPTAGAVPPRAGRSPSPWPSPGLRSTHRRVEYPDYDGPAEALLKAAHQQHEHD